MRCLNSYLPFDSFRLRVGRFFRNRLVVAVWLLVEVVVSSAAGFARADGEEAFEKAIRPLLLERCIECHGPTKQEHGVRLDRRRDVFEGKAGDQPLIVPGDPVRSRVFQVLQHAEDDIAMPPSGRLPEEQRQAVHDWIQAGAPWPDTADLEGEAKRRLERWRQHWAFQPLAEPDLSAHDPATSVVDFLIDQKLRAEGLQRSPEASPQVLVRRLAIAVTGLPPEREDVQQGEAAAAAGSWEAWYAAYVDRLLSSPHYGERWGRYWLDLARYADTRGYVFMEDRDYKDAWRYREWVIRSLNSDMGWDEFVRRQLAADRLPGAENPEQLAAMGFLTLGRRFLNNPHDIIDDRIDLVTRGLLGLTVACARCHDHKYDPIPAADYYSLYGVFASSDEPKNEPSTLRLVDRPQPVEPVIFVRGNPANRGAAVPRRFLSALAGDNAAAFRDGSGRLELAAAITDPRNPLTARVAVNRIWMQLWGRGLVETPSDFGVRTEPPTHPELLDWLARDWIEHGWSQKRLIRSIVLSQSWRQRSDRRPDAEVKDPENRLYARMNRLRLDFESQRDAALCAAGRLDRTIGGPSADLAADPNVLRRAIYAKIDRQNLPGLFRTFDFASPDTHAPRRYQTTVPQQGLYYLNNAFVMNRAGEIAAASAGPAPENAAKVTPESRIERLFQLVLLRRPTADEQAAALILVNQLQQLQGSGEAEGWNYGFGELVESESVVRNFQPLRTVREGRLQYGEQLPDPQLGYVFLNKTGGHTGRSLEHCAIRRWRTERTCRVLVHGVISHANEQGDGIRMRVVAPGGRVLADVSVHNGTQPLAVPAIELQAGDWLDFVADCAGGPSHDTFGSRFVVSQSMGTGAPRVWKSDEDFREVAAPRQDAWAQLAHTLLMTNEFSFVD
ncbi:MAG: PSD1 and planctomycete cytochrome C domain-containing protein [Planctomycetaceae bacterium]